MTRNLDAREPLRLMIWYCHLLRCVLCLPAVFSAAALAQAAPGSRHISTGSGWLDRPFRLQVITVPAGSIPIHHDA